MTHDLAMCSSAVPLPPEGLRATGQGPSWVVMEWNSANALTVPIVTMHVLEYRLTFEPEWTRVPDTRPTFRRNVTDLYPSATYQVSTLW